MLEDGLSELFRSKTESSARTQRQLEREQQKQEKNERRRRSDPGPLTKFLRRGSNQAEAQVGTPGRSGRPGKNRVPYEREEWLAFCEQQNALKSRLQPRKTILLKASHFFAYITSVFDLNDPAENDRSTPIPDDWFSRSEKDKSGDTNMSVKKASDGSLGHDPAVDDRLPMFVIIGAPFSGKTVTARELGRFLAETYSRKKGSPSSRLFETIREAVWIYFSGSSHQPTNDEPGACYHFDAPTGPRENFADGDVICYDVNHISIWHDLRQRELAHNADIEREAQVASFCSSLAAVRNDKPDDDSPDRLDNGRRMALSEALLDPKNHNKVVIFTEYLPKSDDYSDTEFAADAYRTAARVFRRRLIPIYLTCSTEEHQRRFEHRQKEEVDVFERACADGIVFPENLIAAMTPEKLKKAARALGKPDYNARELYTFSRPANHANGRYSYTEPESKKEPAFPAEHHGLHIDTTGRTPREVATVIRDFAHDVISGKAKATRKVWAATREQREMLEEEERKKKEEEREKKRKEQQQEEQLKRGQQQMEKRNSENSDWVVVDRSDWTASI